MRVERNMIESALQRFVRKKTRDLSAAEPTSTGSR